MNPVPLRLERIAAPRPHELDELYAVCCQAPNYWMLTEGKQLPGKDAIARWFDGSDLPPGRSIGDQQTFGVRLGDELIGVVTALRGWRYPEQAMISLLLLSERWQGYGYGRQAYELMEQQIARWPGMQLVRIGIIASNAPAFPFWRKMGFAETGERKRDISFLAETVILEKPLPKPALATAVSPALHPSH